MNTSDGTLIFTYNQKDESIVDKTLAQEDGITVIRIKGRNEVTDSRIGEIKSATHCIFFLPSSDEKEGLERVKFKKLPIGQIEFSKEGLGFLGDGGKAKEGLEENGFTYIKLGQEGDVGHFRRSIKDYEGAGEERDVDERLLVRTLWMVESCIRSGLYNIGKKFCEKVTKYMERVERIDYVRMLQDMLAYVYWITAEGGESSADNYSEAKKIYEQIIANIKEPGNVVWDMERYCYNLGSISYIQRKYAQAELNYERAIKYSSEIFGSDHEEVLLKKYDMISVLRMLGKYGDAEELCLELQGKRIDIESDIVYELALIKLEQKKYREAKNHFEVVYKEREEKWGKEHVKTVACGFNLGASYYGLEEYKEAESYYKGSLYVRKKTGELENCLLAMYNLGLVYMSLGKEKEVGRIDEKIQEEIRSREERRQPDYSSKFKKIEGDVNKILSNNDQLKELQVNINTKASREGLEKIEKLFKRLKLIHREYAEIQNAGLEIKEYLAEFYKDLHEFNNAEKMYEDLYDAYKTHLSFDDKKVVDCVNNLTSVYTAQGKLEHTEKILKELIERQTGIDRAHGRMNSSKQTLNSRIQLANACTLHGKYEKAEKLYLRILVENREENLISERYIRERLAQVYQYQRRYREAEEIYEEVVKEIQNVSYEVDSMESSLMLVETYQAQSRYDDAEQLAKEILEFALSHDREAERIRALFRLASLYVATGRYDDAEELYDIIQRYFKETFKHPSWLIEYYFGQIRLCRAQERFQEALYFCEVVLKLSERTIGRSHPLTLLIYKRLSALYIDQERYKDAENVLAKVLEKSKEVFGEDNIKTLDFKYDLAIVQSALGNSKLAEDTIKSIIKLSQKLGDDSPDTLRFMNGLANLYCSKEKFEEAEGLFDEVLTQGDTLGKNHPEIVEATKREYMTRTDKQVGMESVDAGGMSQNKERLQDRINRLRRQLLRYYNETKENPGAIEALFEILEQSNEGRRFELAKMYNREERYVKTIRLYMSILRENDSILRNMDIKFVADVLRVIVEAYIELNPKQYNLEHIFDLISQLVTDVELKFGCMILKELKGIKRAVHEGYILQKRYKDFALKHDNKAIKSRFRVKDFLDLKEFDGRITPLTCFLGDNSSGKTIMMRILYACQGWACIGTNQERMKENKGANKDMFLAALYSKMVEPDNVHNDEESQLEYLEDKKAKLSKEQDIFDMKGSFEEQDIFDMKGSFGEKDFFEENLKEMIKYQIQSIGVYFRKTNDDENIWERISGGKETQFYGENLFFATKVSFNSEKGFDVDLRWKIDQLTVKRENGIVQVRMCVGKNKQTDTFFFYIREELKGSRFSSNVLPVYSSFTDFFVTSISRENIKLCILEILFERTPFVFFEGSCTVFPANRNGYSALLDQLINLIPVATNINVPREDIEFAKYFVNYKEMRRFDRSEIHLMTLYGNELEDPYISENIEGRHEDLAQKIEYLFQEVEMKSVLVERDLVSNRLFVKFFDPESDKKFGSSEVATSTLSFSPLNKYIRETLPSYLRDSKTRDSAALKMKFSGLPGVIIYDEPESSLHPDGLIKLSDFLCSVYEELRGNTIPWSLVLITHSPFILYQILNWLIAEYGYRNVEDHYSVVKFSYNDGAYKGVQVRIEQDGKYEDFPYSKANAKLYESENEAERRALRGDKDKKELDLSYL